MNEQELKELPVAIRRKVVHFIDKEIPNTKFLEPDGKPKKEWNMFYGDTWDAATKAARTAAWEAARNAARTAAWDAAWGAARNAARDAATKAARTAAWEAATKAARNAVRDAAWDAAWKAAASKAASKAAASKVAWKAAPWVAARDTAWTASWDAALFTEYIITADLEFKDKAKHEAHAKARWEVWKKGYGLLCDVDGVLYVYAIGKPKGTKHKHEWECKCGATMKR